MIELTGRTVVGARGLSVDTAESRREADKALFREVSCNRSEVLVGTLDRDPEPCDLVDREATGGVVGHQVCRLPGDSRGHVLLVVWVGPRQAGDQILVRGARDFAAREGSTDASERSLGGLWPRHTTTGGPLAIPDPAELRQQILGPKDLVDADLRHAHEQVENRHREQDRRVREDAACAARQ
ncbi:MAG TPA: hypothetical protein VGA36_01920 [Nitriliruptorales bacterium]